MDGPNLAYKIVVRRRLVRGLRPLPGSSLVADADSPRECRYGDLIGEVTSAMQIASIRGKVCVAVAGA